jgi:hypothetical protein
VAVVTLGKCLDEGLAKFAEARQRGCPNDHRPEKPMPGNTTQRYQYCLDEEDQEPQRQHDSVHDDVRRQRALGSPGRRQVKVSNAHGPIHAHLCLRIGVPVGFASPASRPESPRTHGGSGRDRRSI